MNTPFTEAFALSLFLLKSNELNFDDVDKFLETLKAEKFSDRAIGIIEQKLTFRLDKALRLSKEHVRLALANKISNVFGGMGSWNDQGFAAPEDQAEFDRVSADLFMNIQKVSAALSRYN